MQQLKEEMASRISKKEAMSRFLSPQCSDRRSHRTGWSRNKSGFRDAHRCLSEHSRSAWFYLVATNAPWSIFAALYIFTLRNPAAFISSLCSVAGWAIPSPLATHKK